MGTAGVPSGRGACNADLNAATVTGASNPGLHASSAVIAADLWVAASTGSCKRLVLDRSNEKRALSGVRLAGSICCSQELCRRRERNTWAGQRPGSIPGNACPATLPAVTMGYY